MTDNWRTASCAMLADGLGVEDCAVRLGVPVADVRCLVGALRASGKLMAVLRGEGVGG